MGLSPTRRFAFSPQSRISPKAIPPPSLAEFVNTTTGFAVEPWQRIICERLAELPHQQGQRLLIHGPPQHGKSILVSQRFPAWSLGVRPEQRIRIACYNVSHAERFTRVIRDLMRDESYQALFPAPGCRLPAICPGDEWSTATRADARDANPSMKALGLGSGFTGLGVDTLLVDDPYKDAQEARSVATNLMLWDWWTNVVVPRMNTATNIVVMFHRWWEGDFAGRLIDQGGWELLRFPAIADGLAGDPTGRALGEPLSPRYPLAHLEGVKRIQGTSFQALYQGTPYPAEGSMFKAGRVGWVGAVPSGADRVRRWDVASTADGGDYTAGVLMAKVGERYYVEDLVYGQWSGDQRDAIIRETARRDAARGPVKHILPQDPGSAGKDMAGAFIRLLSGFSVSVERESGDKVTRADPFASQWNVGDGAEYWNVAIVKDGPEHRWNDWYLSCMTAFPNGKIDDPVDASSGAFNALAGESGPAGVWLI